jgi:uncharacterized protein YacL (UPF0231 family)
MWLPYVYKLTHKITKQIYIGMRSANVDVAENDLGKKYFTSSSKVKKDFNMFDVEIVAYCKSHEDAFLLENQLIESYWNSRCSNQ